MNTHIKSILIFTAIILLAIAPTFLVRARQTEQAGLPAYRVACLAGKLSGAEAALKDHYQFRKVLMDGANKGKQYTCFFRINDASIKCVNPNWVRSGGKAELQKDGFTTNEPIAGGNLGKSKAGTVCYFKESDDTHTNLRSKWLPENNLLEQFPGAQENRVTTVQEAQKILDQPIAGQ